MNLNRTRRRQTKRPGRPDAETEFLRERPRHQQELQSPLGHALIALANQPSFRFRNVQEAER